MALSERKMAALEICYLIAASLSAANCDEHTDPSHYLIARLAEQQPESADLGRIVVVDSKGGTGLRFHTRGGGHILPGTEPEANMSCMAPPDGRFRFLVIPEKEEALVTIELMDAGDDAAPEDACTGSILENVALPVPRQIPEEPEGMGGSGGENASGSGGTEPMMGGMGGSDDE